VNDEKPVTGMAGIEGWTLLTASRVGKTTASISCSRLWEHGEKDVRIFCTEVGSYIFAVYKTTKMLPRLKP
jgi:hypothetical protein